MAIDKAKEKAIQAAAAPVREKIRTDRERVDAKLQEFLDYLADNLLYQKPTADEGFRQSGVTSKSKPEDFKIAIGVTPGVYIKDFQMEIVGRLLRSGCEFTLEELAEVVGYSHGGSLSRAFTSWAKLTPAEFRERTQALRAAGVEPPDLKFFRTGWALGVEFELAERSELEELMGAFIGLRNLRGSTLPRDSPLLAAAEILLAEEFSSWLIDLSVEEQEQGIRLAGVFQTPALFEYLLEQSRVVGRDDREKGVWIAELAQESLKGLAWRLNGEQIAHQRIRRWAYLGNARRLNDDLAGAESAFSEARHIAAAFREIPSQVQAELSYFESWLRFYQRRFTDALHLTEDVFSHLREFGNEKLRVEAFIQKGILKGHEGRWLEALKCFRQASSCTEHLAQSHLLLSLESGLVWANFKTARFREAEAALARAFNLAESLGYARAYPHLLWLEGIGAAEKKDVEKAERSLGEAWVRFQELRDSGHAAVVALELAIVLSWRSKRSEVLEVAAAALPVLQSLELDKECLVLIAVLEKAILEQKIDTALLFSLRSRLGAELGMLELLGN